MKLKMLIGIIFITIGGLILFKEIFKKITCQSVTKGAVVEIHRSESKDSQGNNSITYYPVFEYEVSGEVYIKETKVGSSNCKFEIGQVIDIYYNAKKPDIYYPKGNLGTTILGFTCIIAGILVIVYI